MQIIHAANPFSSEFQEAAKAFDTLKTAQKVAAIIASIVGGIFTPFILFTGSFLAFTKTVQYFKQEISDKDSNVGQVARPILGHRRRETTQGNGIVCDAPLRTLNQIETEDVNPHLAVTQDVQSMTVPNLDRYGLSREEYDNICLWYEFNKEDLESEGYSRHLKPRATGLTRTVIYISKGPHKGLHVRSKITVGIGSFCKATRCLHIDTGKSKIARSGSQSNVTNNELASNEKYVGIDPNEEYFVTGAVVKHKGSLRDRDAIREQCKEVDLPANISHLTGSVPVSTSVKKVTLIMNEIPGGMLSEDLYKPFHRRKLSTSDYMKILLHLNKGLILAHKEGLVDLDYKPENILLDDNVPKMTDFGLAHTKGKYVFGGTGTRGYISPEVLKRALIPFSVQPANQMWIHGCIMAHMFKGRDFETWTEQLSGNAYKIVFSHEFSNAIDQCFPKNKEEGTIDWCIAQCLKYNPADRISAEELQPHLEKLLSEMQ